MQKPPCNAQRAVSTGSLGIGFGLSIATNFGGYKKMQAPDHWGKAKQEINFLKISPEYYINWKIDSFGWGQSEKMIRCADLTLAGESTTIVASPKVGELPGVSSG